MLTFIQLIVHDNGYASHKIFTVGIINAVSNHTVTVEGFKIGMAELGYVEGKDVRYIYNGVIDDS